MKLLSSLVIPLLAAVVSAGSSPRACSSLEIRKEWRSLSKPERKAWIDAVNCLGKAPRSGKLKPSFNTSSTGSIFDTIAPVSEQSSYHDDLVYAHMNLNPIIHFTGLFLPWHRQVTLGFRSLLVHRLMMAFSVSTYTNGPTLCESNADTKALLHVNWAWEKDTKNFEKSSIWDKDPKYGLGGFGDPNDDYTVKTGGLDMTFAYPIPHKLRRRYSPYPFAGGPFPLPNVSAASTFTPEEVRKVLDTQSGNFTAFQYSMEKLLGMHGSVHVIVGGDLAGSCPKGSSNTSVCPVEGAPTFSANEPMFHMHHGNIDRLWWLWQEKNQLNKQAFRGGSVQNISNLDQFPNGQPPWLNKNSIIPAAGMYKEYSITDVMDTRKWPLCYVYA
ncbi:tyrosinase [Ceratobasidium sp. AG-Ba]|nr:tyrosinase [Ceratobasidium sp. AG-Ba]